MDERLIFDGQATIEDFLILHSIGYEFIIENGHVTCYGREAVHNG